MQAHFLSDGGAAGSPLESTWSSRKSFKDFLERSIFPLFWLKSWFCSGGGGVYSEDRGYQHVHRMELIYKFPFCPIIVLKHMWV